jgi:hypothetical protein
VLGVESKKKGSIMNQVSKLQFNCVGCRQALEIEPSSLGQLVNCPDCSAQMTVGLNENMPPIQHVETRPNAPLVPMEMGMRGLGTFKAQVPPEDAGRMANSFLGAMLALLGVMVCAMLGLNVSNKS